MSCWVVPSLAAELWGVPLEQVLGEIRAGAIVSKKDYGFTVVDVAPDSREIAPPPVRRRVPPPMTFIPAGTLEEAVEVATAVAAEISPPSAPVVPAPTFMPVEAATPPIAAIEPARPAKSNGRHYPPPEATIDDESEDGPDPNFGEPDDGKPLDWRAARARSSMQRRRPPTRFN